MADYVYVMGTNPGTILESKIDFPRPRTLEMLKKKLRDYEERITNLMGKIDLSKLSKEKLFRIMERG